MQTSHYLQVLDDLKNLGQDDTLDLNQWWDGFSVKNMQIEEMDKMNQGLNKMKNEVKMTEIPELKQQQKALIEEINDNLSQIQQHKTPK